MRTFTAIVNPAAGGGRARGARSGAGALLTSLARSLRDAGAELAVEYSRDLEHAVSIARSAAGVTEPADTAAAAESAEASEATEAAGRAGAGRGGPRGAAGTEHVILGVGGDGMVGAVGGALAETGAPFGIVPAGRGNDFARQLGLPTEPAALAELLLTAPPKPVDTIRVNGLAVLGSVYTGVDAVANRNANRSRLLRGSAAYYVGALRAVTTWRPVTYGITVDGERRERRGYTVVIANSGYYGFDRRIAPSAQVDDGLLDVVIIRHGPKSMFFSVMKDLEDGSHVRRPEVEVLRGREIVVEADRPLPYGADGEVDGSLPVTARVMPGALQVIRP